MKRPRIALIGDTTLAHGELTDAGAIATELALLDRADVGFRSVAADRASHERLETRFRQSGITTWLTTRYPDHHPSHEPLRADLRMGDPIDITEIFDRDVVVLASRNVRLRRFLADLPVHTRPDVRILASIHFEEGVPRGERTEDVLRFDTIVGSAEDFEQWSMSSNLPDCVDAGVPVMSRLQQRMHGSNVRALMSWDEDGSAMLAEPLEDIVTVRAGNTRIVRGSAPWAAFVATVALGMALRQPYPEIAEDASRAFVSRARDSVRGDSPYT